MQYEDPKAHLLAASPTQAIARPWQTMVCHASHLTRGSGALLLEVLAGGAHSACAASSACMRACMVPDLDFSSRSSVARWCRATTAAVCNEWAAVHDSDRRIWGRSTFSARGRMYMLCAKICLRRGTRGALRVACTGGSLPGRRGCGSYPSATAAAALETRVTRWAMPHRLSRYLQLLFVPAMAMVTS